MGNMSDLINITFIVPEIIKQGLDSGAYERVGGVIRETASKNVVHWLREGAVVSTKGHKIIAVLSTLGGATLAAADFVYMYKNFKNIDDQLRNINMKLDAQNLSKIQSGLSLAQKAEQMKDLDNAKLSMSSALGMLEEGANIFKNLFMNIPKNDKEYVPKSFNSLKLAVVAQLGMARIHLWNGEYLLARRDVGDLRLFLGEAYSAYRDYTKRRLNLRESYLPRDDNFFTKFFAPGELPGEKQEVLLNFNGWLNGYLVEIGELQRRGRPLRGVVNELAGDYVAS